jgi:uncharacterized membrane protein
MHGWGSAGTAFMALITVAVLALVWVVVRRVAELSERVSTAREQLDARLARGEIDTEEHRERLGASSGHRIEE